MGLEGLDLSGLTGYIRYDAGEVAFAKILPEILIGFLGLLFVIWLVSWALKVSYPRSRAYRELMSDMYIVGKIKQIALEDKVDLNQELKDYIRIVKKDSIVNGSKGIDDIVHMELKQKIADDFEDKKDKAK
jgi:hypothetical protein